MSDVENPSNPAADYDSRDSGDSAAVSPLDTPTQPKNFEPITHDQDHDTDNGEEESSRMTGTMRRNPPPAISTRSRDNYGMFSSPRTRGLLLTLSKAPRIPTIPRKSPPPKAFKRLLRMRATKACKALHRRLASTCFLLSHYHQRASRRWADEHLPNTTLLTKAKASQ